MCSTEINTGTSSSLNHDLSSLTKTSNSSQYITLYIAACHQKLHHQKMLLQLLFVIADVIFLMLALEDKSDIALYASVRRLLKFSSEQNPSRVNIEESATSCFLHVNLLILKICRKHIGDFQQII